MAKINAGDFLLHFAERSARDVGGAVSDLRTRKREELDRAQQLEQAAKKAEREERIALLREAASARDEAREITRDQRAAEKAARDAGEAKRESETPYVYGGNRYRTEEERLTAIEQEAAARRRGAPPVASTRERSTPLSEQPDSRGNQRREAASAAVRWSSRKGPNGWQGVARALRKIYPSIAGEADKLARDAWESVNKSDDDDDIF